MMYEDIIARLQQSLTSPAQVRDSDGSYIATRSVEEIKAALAYYQGLQHAPPVRAIRFTTSKFGVSKC